MFVPFAKHGLDQDHDPDQEHVHKNLMKKQNKIKREMEMYGDLWKKICHIVSKLLQSLKIVASTHQ